MPTGGCLCGAVRYSIVDSTEPIYNVICHCDNCKKASGSLIKCASIYPKASFEIVAGIPKQYRDGATDSTKPLFRHFCGDCGGALFSLTPLNEQIVSVSVGSMDGSSETWRPNKEQYIETKSHWLPDFKLAKKSEIPEKHRRGPVSPPPTGRI
ncbi:hypothetical protein P152DRAFT_510908 [Eremomyces bilateralis CBS 781.70]|uniref:CENP-V/GFA domain-containing protein n=1 Tax=Eremomyces bilateralis CBS 781.70 TaxID=1392243 RepID=A0A6G1GDY2_9PEZI|nr:uncharacterized protein P152DRAFT_510908 [Eremomyces bilateralis CBS 781.70]KAF1816069.1 hypothetical protein P152DRAFT_510908 [Eremomyces bilateralis CBS 781.70]